MAQYTAELNLYKPNRADDLPVDETLADNFQKIDDGHASIRNEMSDFNKRVGGEIVNVDDYGADPTGAAESGAAFQDALDYAGSVNGTLYIPDNTYKISQALTIPSNVSIVGEKGHLLDGSAIPVGTWYGDSSLIKSTGSQGTGTPLAANTSVFARTITVSNGSLFSAGDLIYIDSTDKFDSTATSTSYTKSELIKVRSVSGTTLTLEGSAMFPYTASTTTVYKIDPVKNITIENVNILMGGENSKHSGINITFGENIRVINSSIDRAEDGGIYYYGVYNGWILNNAIMNSTSPDTSSGGGYSAGYGIAIMDSSRNILIDGNSFHNNRHSITGGGTAGGFVTVSNNFSHGCFSNSFDCHEPCYYWSFIGNKVQGASGGIISRGKYTTISDNEIVDVTTDGIIIRGYSFDVAEMNSFVVSNNKINGASYGINIVGANGIIKNITITGNILENCKTEGIHMPTAAKVVIANNSFYNMQGRCMRVAGATDVTIEGNQLSPENQTQNIISIYNCDRVSVVGNIFRSGYYQLLVEYTQTITVQGNTFSNALLYGIFPDANTVGMSIVGNNFVDFVANGAKPIRATGGSNYSVMGNVCANCTGGANFHPSGITNMVAIGNVWQTEYSSGMTNFTNVNNILTG